MSAKPDELGRLRFQIRGEGTVTLAQADPVAADLATVVLRAVLRGEEVPWGSLAYKRAEQRLRTLLNSIVAQSFACAVEATQQLAREGQEVWRVSSTDDFWTRTPPPTLDAILTRYSDKPYLFPFLREEFSPPEIAAVAPGARMPGGGIPSGENCSLCGDALRWEGRGRPPRFCPRPRCQRRRREGREGAPRPSRRGQR